LLAYRASFVIDAPYCVKTVEVAITRHGMRGIMAPGRQFTGVAFSDVLKNLDIQISLDGNGSGRDNVFVERRSRCVKHEVCVKACNCVSDDPGSIGRYPHRRNSFQPHSSIDDGTPDEASVFRR
jgi:putative transposase